MLQKLIYAGNMQKHDELGEKWRLPFGDHIIMSHYADKYVYIKNVFGEPQDSFLRAYKALKESRRYGANIDGKIKVICASGYELRGTFKQLECIVKQFEV